MSDRVWQKLQIGPKLLSLTSALTKKRRCFYPHSHHWQVSGIDDSPFSTPLLTSIYRRKVGQIICMDDENCLRNLATLHRWAVFKILLIFHYPAWLVGILRMACQGSLILFRKQPTRVLKTAHIVLVFIPINRYIDFSVFKKNVHNQLVIASSSMLRTFWESVTLLEIITIECRWCFLASQLCSIFHQPWKIQSENTNSKRPILFPGRFSFRGFRDSIRHHSTHRSHNNIILRNPCITMVLISG